jgi:hypothetical protein
MSRSYRRPFAAITGIASAKDDKRMAQHGVRRKQNLALKSCFDYEDFLLPHRLECAWNDPWCWRRDGVKFDYSDWRDSEDEFHLRYHRKLMRK